jgi:hypothetical protein
MTTNLLTSGGFLLWRGSVTGRVNLSIVLVVSYRDDSLYLAQRMRKHTALLSDEQR